ncbi:M23 family metallopeptidase [Desulfurispora thermophila]|uniref:M23 family metallopeptidase n=1 Tax=Desulfurispora thermophila TaxID=265470 RepID=UPI00036F4739|nr:M23 family metallopeptidase [Desulfurispora thermophila]
MTGPEEERNYYDAYWKATRRYSRSPGWGGFSTPPGRRRGLWLKVLAAAGVLLVLLYVRQWDSPVGEQLRLGLRYILTTEINLQPALQKAVELGLQMTGTQAPQAGPAEPQVVETMGPTGTQLLVPVSGRVVRRFGWQKDTLDNLERFHPGIDIAAPASSEVKAAMNGKVEKIAEDRVLGLYVLLDHGGGTYTLYAGLANLRVAAGQYLAAGQVIGEVGGKSDGPEQGLHFELRLKSKLVDPLTSLQIPAR